MKKLIISAVLLASNFAMAKTSRIINVFYDGRNGELAVNTERESGRPGFIRTNKIVLVSSELSLCESGCLASIEPQSYTSFNVVVAGHSIATFLTNDPDNLLPSTVFQTREISGKEALVLNLDTLKKSARAEVQ